MTGKSGYWNRGRSAHGRGDYDGGRVLLFLCVLFLLLAVACQAPTAEVDLGERSDATGTPTVTAETATVPTETVPAAEAETSALTPVASPEEITVSAVAPAEAFEYMIDATYEEGGWQLRGVRRTRHGGWESAFVRLSERVSVGGMDQVPGHHGALVWDYSSGEGAGPGNLSAGPLYLVDLPSGRAEMLFPENVVSARWMPDGQGFGYLLATEETYELHVRDASGDERMVARDVPREFSFAPDGNAVAFTRESRYGLPGTPGLYVVDLMSGAEQMASEVDRAGTGGSGPAWAPLWSPDGGSLLLRAYGGGSEPGLVWAAADGSWHHTLSLEELDRAAGAALGQEKVCTNQEFLPVGATTLITGAGPCSGDPLMGAMAEATDLVVLALDSARGTVTPAGSVPAPVATFFFLGYRQQDNSAVLYHPADPANSAIFEVVVP